MFTLLGDVEKPGVYELPIGASFKRLLEDHGRGVKGGRRFKFMMSGVSSGVMVEKDLDTPMDFHTMRAIDSSLGSGGYIVFGEDTSALDVAYAYSRFLANESCGQCQSCKTGTARITEHLENLAYGVGSQVDLEAIETDLGLVATGNRCFLPVAEKALIRSLFSNFPEDFFAGLNPRVPVEIPVAKIKGYDAEKGNFFYDPKYPLKRPDGGFNAQGQGKFFYSTRASMAARKLTRA
jgi:NADH:ubiquinone oxidoreductase subunit F (NADH-binding)